MTEKQASDPNADGDGTPGAKKPSQGASEFSEFERLISHEYNADYEEEDFFAGEEERSLMGGFGTAPEERPSAKPLRPGEVRSVRIPLTVESPGACVASYELGLSISLRQVSGVAAAAATGKAPGEEAPEDEIDLLDGRTTLMFGEEDEDGDDGPASPPEASRGWWSKLFSFWR